MPAHPGQKDWLRPCTSGIDFLLILVRDGEMLERVIVHELRKVPVQSNPDPPRWSHIVKMTRRNAILHVTKTVVGMFSMDIKISKCMNNVEKYIKLFLGSKMLTGPNLTDVSFARYRSK